MKHSHLVLTKRDFSGTLNMCLVCFHRTSIFWKRKMLSLNELIDKLIALRESGVSGELFPLVIFSSPFSDIRTQQFIEDVEYIEEKDKVEITLI